MPGQLEVEDDEVVGLGFGLGQSDDAVEGEVDLARQILKMQLHELGDVELVFDDQYADASLLFSPTLDASLTPPPSPAARAALARRAGPLQRLPPVISLVPPR